LRRSSPPLLFAESTPTSTPPTAPWLINANLGINFVNSSTNTQSLNFLAAADRIRKSVDIAHFDFGLFNSQQESQGQTSLQTTTDYDLLGPLSQQGPHFRTDAPSAQAGLTSEKMTLKFLFSAPLSCGRLHQPAYRWRFEEEQLLIPRTRLLDEAVTRKGRGVYLGPWPTFQSEAISV
jgi:hypothetical protein